MADNLFDHVLVFDTEDQCRNTLHANAVLADSQEPLVINAKAADGKWFHPAYADAGITVSLQVFGQQEIRAPGFRLLVQSSEVREDLWAMVPGACELILDRAAGCEGRDFVVRSQPGRSIYSVLFSPIFAGSCYPERRDDEFRRFFETLALAGGIPVSRTYQPTVFDSLVLTQETLNEIERRLLRASALVVGSNTVADHERSFLLRSLSAALDYVREHPYKTTVSAFLFLLGSPLYAAYSSALEEVARPFFAEFINLVVRLVIQALS